MFIYKIEHSRAIRPCHPNSCGSILLVVVLPRGDQQNLLRKPLVDLVKLHEREMLSLLTVLICAPSVSVCVRACVLHINRLYTNILLYGMVWYGMVWLPIPVLYCSNRLY